MDPELPKGVFSLGEQLGRKKVWHKSRQGASVFLADRAAGMEEEARSRDGGKAEGEVTSRQLDEGGSAVSWGHCA